MSRKKRLISPLNTVVLAQFLSAFSDNINFFLIVGLVNRHNPDQTNEMIAIIQLFFLSVFVILAPIVGAYADRNAKSKVLLVGNVLKALGILLLLLHIHPIICYIFVGIGAVIYSPAKYGILAELTNSEDELLRANAKVEGYTILAILAGTVAGGFLARDSDLPGIIAGFAVYMLSTAIALYIPARKGNANIRYADSARIFLRDLATLFRNTRARFALLGTGAFWLTATVVRIALIAWLPINLGIEDTDQQSMIIGIVAIGVVLSSFLTPRLVPSGKLHRSFYFGVMMVVTLFVAVFTRELWVTVSLLFLLGMFGGCFVVPMNTMVQEEGKDLIGAGQTIAVQNFSEYLLTVIGLVIYIILMKFDVSVNYTMVGISLVLFSFMAYLGFVFAKMHEARRDTQ